MQSITYINELGKQVTFSSEANSPKFLISVVAPVSKTVQTYTAIGQHGQKRLNTIYNPRTITCECIYACETDIVSYKKGWQEIVDTFAPHLKGTLIYTNDAGTYEIDVSPLETPILSKQQFAIQFEADFPLWRNAESTEYVFGTVKPLWKFPFTFANGPLKMGEWQKEFEYVNNNSIETPFKLVIQGVSDYCKITNDNGEFIKVNKAVATGQTLTIDTATGIVTFADENGVISYANQYVSLDSTLGMKLHEGVNILTYENGVTSLPIATISINQYFLEV
jgi:phage-related protein